jgi:hypothetical protein
MNEVAPAPGVALTTDLSRDESIPYFLWDDPMTMRDLTTAARRWNQLERHLDRRRDFWRFLLSRWREQGLLS